MTTRTTTPKPLRLVREDPEALPKDGDFLTAYGSRLRTAERRPPGRCRDRLCAGRCPMIAVKLRGPRTPSQSKKPDCEHSHHAQRQGG